VKVKKLVAAGTVVAVTSVTAGLGLAGSANASVLPTQASAAQESLADATVTSPTPQFLTAIAHAAGHVVAQAAQAAVNAAAGAAAGAVVTVKVTKKIAPAAEDVAEESSSSSSSGVVESTAPVPALNGAVPADAQFNAP
jgi:hypothetical protein